MSATVIEHAGGRAEVRLTPWDERALGMRTAEIVRLEVSDDPAGRPLIEEVERWGRENGVRYLFGRVDAAAPSAKKAVLDAGFAIVECSIALSRAGFAGLPPVPARMRPALRPAEEADIGELERIARDDFNHGRFLEDPAIDPALAAARTANWIGDLVRQRLAYAATSNGKLIGFHAERVSADGRHADLILTGATGRYAIMAMPLWITALESLSARGVQDCSTLISAANTGIVNLYARLGFRFDTTLFGFRKYL
ncbi:MULTISPECIES: GNAT family protein [unclassified Lysobacter]|uniref:GNAT family N-acetyltransferase n=1 Tax=unclassified Lysobacter TaxID=2635362 RepID=UPI001C23A66C|nr:GNAT family protein [Lysobacter sp. MMG2]MBU8975638.1 GNAT family N-acetyltransferase [Lysobacter sp. MMG2]